MKTITFLAMLLAVPALADLRQQIESQPDSWVAYELPANGARTINCSCGSSRVSVFYRVTGHRIDGVRLGSAGCDFDAEGRNVTRLEAVDPRANVELLAALVQSDADDARHALVALAISRGSTDALIDIARHHPSASLRGKALFWVGQQAGQKAAATLKDAVDNDPEESVKTKAVFGISQLPNDQSVPMLIDLLKTHPSRAVRKKAAFWLSQKDDPRALAAFQEILAK